MLFAHAFSGCDTTSRIFGVGKKTIFQKLVNGNSVLGGCSKIFGVPRVDHTAIESTGCKAMVSLFNGNQSDNLESLRYSFLCKKVAMAKTFVKPKDCNQQLRLQIFTLGGLTYKSCNGSERMRHGSY